MFKTKRKGSVEGKVGIRQHFPAKKKTGYISDQSVQEF